MPKKETTPKAKKVAASTEAVVETPKKAAKPAVAKVAAPTSDTVKKLQQNANDTGSTSVQVAVLSEKINSLSKHLTGHKKDNDSRMGLLKMISHRRSLLSYLEKRQPDEYRKVIASLGLRK